MKQRLSVLVAVCALTAAPAVAQAQDQPWLKDRKYTEGIGYRVGDFELHPGLGTEFGFDSNFLHRAPEESPGAIPSLRLRITPSFSAATLGLQRREAAPGPPPTVAFDTALSATYNEFFPITSTDPGRIRGERNVGINLDLNLHVLPQRPWSLDLNANYSRPISSSDAGATGPRDIPRASAELIWTPGSGLLDWRLGYQFTGTIFERATSATNFDHQIRTRGRWRFLPKTAMLFDGRFEFINYPNPNSNPAVRGGATASHPVRAQLGLNGLVTPSFAFLAMVGWGASFYTPKPREDFNSVIGQLEAKWFITPNPSTNPAGAGLALSTISVGFVRDFYDDYYISPYFERDRGYLSLSYFFGGRFLVVVDGGVGPIIYPKNSQEGDPVSDHPEGFTNIRIDASLFGEYRFKDAFGINATFRYGQNVSSTSAIFAGLDDPLKWLQFEAYLGARWLM